MHNLAAALNAAFKGYCHMTAYNVEISPSIVLKTFEMIIVAYNA